MHDAWRRLGEVSSTTWRTCSSGTGCRGPSPGRRGSRFTGASSTTALSASTCACSFETGFPCSNPRSRPLSRGSSGTGSSRMVRSDPGSCWSAGTTCQCTAGRSRRYSAVSRSSYRKHRLRRQTHRPIGRRRRSRSLRFERSIRHKPGKFQMCGIAGQFNFERFEPVDPDTVRRMADAIAHRGPDDEGYFISGPIGLGFRRLSIIDLAGGHQPMSDADETVWVVFNGEIYNFKELRAQLETRGHRFRTRCDTEVIVHGYKEWGTGVFARLNGMFGVAIWDVRQRRLVVARDAMGIKLVYYRSDGGRLIFGSEIRALLAADRSLPEVDPAALSLFLRFRYTPSPLTIFKGIHKLAPGTLLVVEKGKCREERWYDYTPVPFPDDK